MTLSDFQRWLNERGAVLTVDGKPGPATRAAIIDTFRNRNAPAVTPQDIALLAARLNCSPRQIAAAALTESNGGGWDDTGLLKCLWERHFLWRRVKFAVPFLSDPKPGGYTIDADHDGFNDSWEKLADAAMRWGPDIAFECASFGKFQVMGAHWKALGYASALDMVWQQTRSEAAQYEVFARYIEVNGMKGAVRSISADPRACLAFAIGYNGKGQKGYDQRTANNYRRLG